MRENFIENIEALNNAKYLIFLDVSKNKIKELQLDNCDYLQSLLADDNLIKSFGDLPKCSHNLTRLSLNNNQLQNFENAPQMPKLKILELRGNKMINLNNICDLKCNFTLKS